MTVSHSYTNIVSLHQLTTLVHLGVGADERAKKQKVVVDVRFYIPELLSSATDDEGEYICYHNFSEKIYALCTAKEYRLIEFLGQEIYRLVRSETPDPVKIWVKLHKPHILLPYVEKGSSFTYSDLPPFSWVIPE